MGQIIAIRWPPDGNGQLPDDRHIYFSGLLDVNFVHAYKRSPIKPKGRTNSTEKKPSACVRYSFSHLWIRPLVAMGVPSLYSHTSSPAGFHLLKPDLTTAIRRPSPKSTGLIRPA